MRLGGVLEGREERGLGGEVGRSVDVGEGEGHACKLMPVGPSSASARNWGLVPQALDFAQETAPPVLYQRGVETETPRGCSIFLEKNKDGRIQKHSRDAQIQPRLVS